MDTAILIYDGECPLCQGARRWVEAHAVPGAVTTLPCQADALPSYAPGLTVAQCLEAMQLVLPDRRIFAGADALRHLLGRLRWPWRALKPLFYLPGASLLAPVLYAAIARNRHALSALLVRKGGGKACRDDHCDL